MAEPVEALSFLSATSSSVAVPPVVVLCGDEPFLKRLALKALRQRALGEGEGEFSLVTLAGPQVELRDVLDELASFSLFGGGRRLVHVEGAEPFVTRYRGALEQYVERPHRSGVLVLEVGNWPANTRLAKAVAASGLTIECKSPPPAKLAKWLVSWARSEHGAKLTPDAAQLLHDAVGDELGLLDQELAKLAAAAQGAGRNEIDAALVGELASGGRAQSVWELLDAALEGDTSRALERLDQLTLSGESPQALLGQMSSSLRRMFVAVRILEQAEVDGRRPRLREVLLEAQVPNYGRVLDNAEKQLRQLGRERAGQLGRWLLETDLALKSTAAGPARARIVLERFLTRFSREADPRRAASPAGGR